MLGSIYFSISPGSSINVPILIQNRGSEEDSFRLNIDGIPARWISTNATFTELEANTSKEILLTIRIPRSPEATAGRVPFTIEFTSQKYPDQITEVGCYLNRVGILGVFGFPATGDVPIRANRKSDHRQSRKHKRHISF